MAADVPPNQAKLTAPAFRYAEKRRKYSTCAFADRIAHAAIATYRAVVPVHQRLAYTCLAAILCHDASSNEISTVGMGLGTKFLPHDLLVAETRPGQSYGTRLRDCHAEVLVRRALQRYLVHEINWHLMQQEQCPPGQQSANHDDGITLLRLLEWDDNAMHRHRRRRFVLRRGVTLHFYCSSAPCGNAVLKKFVKIGAEPCWPDLPDHAWPNEPHAATPGHAIPNGQFELLVKRDASMASCPPCAPPTTKSATKQATWVINTCTSWCPVGTSTVWSNHGTIHTCSDKLLRWNCLGMQGSLLSSVVMVYMTTLTVGRKHNNVICVRAVCCRAAAANRRDARGNCATPPGRGATQKMPRSLSYFQFHHPTVMGTTVCLDDGKLREADDHGLQFGSDCYAWWAGASTVEHIDGTTGWLQANADNESDRASQLCTQRLAHDVKHVIELAGGHACASHDKDEAMTLQELRGWKRRLAAEYEAEKNRLMTQHPLMRRWRRRCSEGDVMDNPDNNKPCSL